MLFIIISIIRLYELAMIIHIILTWIVPLKERNNNKFFQIIESITEPVLKPLRIKLAKLFPPIVNLRVDISPIIIFFILSIFEGILKIIFF